MGQLNTTIGRLAAALGGALDGDGQASITGIASLEAAGGSDITFVMEPRHTHRLASTRAAGAIVAGELSAKLPLIRVPDVQLAVAQVLAMIGEHEDLPPPGVHPSAIVAKDADLGPDIAIGPGVVVGAGVKIAAGAVLCPNVVVESGAEIGAKTILFPATVICRDCRIGRQCRIGPGAVIGSSGFGYRFESQTHHRFAHVGAVEIGDDVDIGACSCVDRGKFGATRIGDGTKIDNLVQVAHNVQIGRGCVLAGLVGLGGSTRLEDFAVIGGGGGARDNVTIGAAAQVGARSVVLQDVEDGAAVAGYPAIDGQTWLRSVGQFAKLPQMQARIRQLESKVKALESATDHQGTG